MLVYLKTLGCRLNEAELETWAQSFQQAGYQITQDLNQANLIIINSCAVTADAARKSRQLIRRLHRQNPQAKLVVSGCYATLNETEAAQLLGVDLVVGNQNKAKLVEYTLNQLDLQTMPAMSTDPGETALFNRGRQRAFIKVQDGCRYRCSFCIVTVARGRERSRPIQEIVDEINRLHQQGIHEMILTGVHLGGYGHEINDNISGLIQAILTQTDIPRLRLGSLEPWDLPDDFFDLFANPRLMPHLHLPLQSGSDTVLKRMARRCKTTEFAQIVEQARQSIPHFNVTSDIIVGFPGETEQEWQQSFDFIEQIGFGHLHIFSYSIREGTRAADLPDHISHPVKKHRSQQLHQLAIRLKQDFIRQQSGIEHAVLWEGDTQAINNNQQIVYGYTPNYLKVACQIDSTHSLENKIIPAKITTIKDNMPYMKLLF